MFKSLYRTHCRKTGIGAEMLWVRLRSIIPAELVTIVESKTSRFREVATENATPPPGTRLSKCRRTLAR